MQKQPFFIMLSCFIVGIFLCDFFSFSARVSFVLLFFSTIFISFIFFKIHFFKKFKNVFLAFFFFSVGVFSHFFNSQKPHLPNFEGEKIIIFKISKKLNSNKKYRKYEILATTELAPKSYDFSAVISVSKEDKPLDFKNFYQTKVYLNKVESPNNDFQFNYAKYLERKKIYYQCFASDEVLVSPKKELSFSEKIKQKRSEVLENINNSHLKPQVKEFLKGIILADRTEMDEEMVSDFSKSGLVHFLAISGTHFAIIFWMILFLLKPFFSAKRRNIPIVASLALLWGFAVFIDYGSSVVRSCLMITAYYGFVILQRKPDLLHALAIAGFGILIFDTQQLFDVGFQLSFLAVLGIYWLNEPLLKRFPTPKNKVQNFFINIISISFAAQIATLPLVIYYFHQYSLLSILANLVVLPFSEIIIIFSLVMTIFFAFGEEFYLLNNIFGKIIDVLLQVIHFFAHQDVFYVKNISINIWEVFLIFIVIYYLRFILKRNDLQNFIRFSVVLLIIILIRISFNFYYFEKSEVMSVHSFDKNFLLVKENRKAVFWVGENDDEAKILKYLIEPYLVSRRISEYEIKKIPLNKKFVKISNKVYKID
jgi:competence protein ComEC